VQERGNGEEESYLIFDWDGCRDQQQWDVHEYSVESLMVRFFAAYVTLIILVIFADLGKGGDEKRDLP
jgi:hypothetical protein